MVEKVPSVSVLDEETYLSRQLLVDKRDQSSGLLWDSPELTAIAERYNVSNKTFDDSIQAGCAAVELLHGALDFAATNTATPPLAQETLADRKKTNCYGHTIVLSELLEKIGVDHMVSFANQHGFVILADDISNRVFMLDAAARFSQDITGMVGGESPLKQVSHGKLRAENTLYTFDLASRMYKRGMMDDVLDMYSWMSFADIKARDGLDDARSFRLQLLSYPSIPGRELLKQYYNGIIAFNRSRYKSTYDFWKDLDGIYPDVDVRNRLSLAKQAIKGLMSQEQYDEALQLAIVVHKSSRNDHSLNDLLLPNTIRDIAKRTQNDTMMQWALGGG